MADYDIADKASRNLSIFNDLGDISDTPLTVSSPYEIKQTWDASGEAMSGFRVDITNTASLPTSSPFSVSVDGSEIFGMSPVGVIRTQGTVQSGANITAANSGVIGFETRGGLRAPSVDGEFVLRDNANNANGSLEVENLTATNDVNVTNAVRFQFDEGNGSIIKNTAADRVSIRDSADTTNHSLTVSSLNATGNVVVAGSIACSGTQWFELGNRGRIYATGIGEFVFRPNSASGLASVTALEFKSKIRYVNETSVFELNEANSGQDVIIRVDSATDVTATIDSSVPIGTRWFIRQVGGGRLLIDGAGVTLNGPYWATAGQWTSASIDCPAVGVFESEGMVEP